MTDEQIDEIANGLRRIPAYLLAVIEDRDAAAATITQLRERAKKAEAREARLREALERTEHNLRWHDPTCKECCGIRPRPDLIRQRINTALNPKEPTDE